MHLASQKKETPYYTADEIAERFSSSEGGEDVPDRESLPDNTDAPFVTHVDADLGAAAAGPAPSQLSGRQLLQKPTTEKTVRQGQQEQQQPCWVHAHACCALGSCSTLWLQCALPCAAVR